MKLFSNRNRPVHLGPFPFERLPRAHRHPPVPPAAPPPSTSAPLAELLDEYVSRYATHRDGTIANTTLADISSDEITRELKATGYFLDAAAMGVCALEGSRDFAIVIAVEFGREVVPDQPGGEWIRGSEERVAGLRSAEIGCVVAGYLRQLGYRAVAHFPGATDVDLRTLAVHAGVATPRAHRLTIPFVGTRFTLAAVITNLVLVPDRPLAPRAVSWSPLRAVSHWFGWRAGISGWERWRRRRRPAHLGNYPIDRIRGVSQPTTLILDDEIPGVPKRASFFSRAQHGDLGAKAQRERSRFATKHPLAFAMRPLMAGLVAQQDGPIAATPKAADPDRDTKALKALAHHLGADAGGVCRMPSYAWYSHDTDGQPIATGHPYAFAMLVDQGNDTMEGAGGDDWISGSQSMRAYLRGAEIACVVAAFIRTLGYSARAHTNADSQILHLPVLLQAGLGELSRIGEVVLHPFLGPRFKSVVVTTDMPLSADRPIDFGLQSMCATCRKCARECPCNAITYGDKVMFNGYEMWKPDVERCTRYRVTNPKGSSCGRCMKVCPYTNEGLLTHRLALWASVYLPFTRRWIPVLDDRLRHGSRNPVKKWWSDLERMPDGTVVRAKAANTRNLRLDATARTPNLEIAYYPASLMPSPDRAEPDPIDRNAALAIGPQLETPVEALLRRKNTKASTSPTRPARE